MEQISSRDNSNIPMVYVKLWNLKEYTYLFGVNGMEYLESITKILNFDNDIFHFYNEIFKSKHKIFFYN